MFKKNNNKARSAAMQSSFAAALLAASLITLPGAARADNMMSACEAEIAAICGGVAKGRGRISACLYANEDKLSATCETEVVEVSKSRTFQRYFPSGAQSLQGSEQETVLRAACTADADKVCTSVQKEKGRFLACVYSRSNSVSDACSTAAKVILD